MYFVGITIGDEHVSQLFDLARIVLEPEFARRSHITLRGPYKRKQDIARSLFEKSVQSVTLSRPSTFFNERQNTVYLRAEIPGIADYWYKPDYPDGIPHLSVYDGPDRTLAWQALTALRKFPWKITFPSSPLKLIDSKERLVTRYILDYFRFDSTLREISEKPYTMEQIKRMHPGQRIHLLERIFSAIHLIHPSSTH